MKFQRIACFMGHVETVTKACPTTFQRVEQYPWPCPCVSGKVPNKRQRQISVRAEPERPYRYDCSGKKKEEAEGNATHRPNLTTIFSCTRHIKSARDVLFGQFCLRFRLLASTRHFQSKNGDASASPTCLVPLCSPQKYTDPIAPRCVTQSPPAELPKIQISRLSRRTLVAAQEITTQIRPWPGRIRPDPATINCT